MAIVQLPVRTDTTNYSTRVDIEGVTYVFALRLNARDGFWYLSVYDSGDLPIRTGIRIVLGASYLRLVVDERKPAGALLAVDVTGSGVEAGPTDLGSRVALIHIGKADAEALQS